MYGAKDDGSFETHTPYLGKAFDGGIKAIRLAKANLGSEGLSTGQEDAKVGTLEEYVAVLPFELLQRKQCIVEIVLGEVEA